MTSAIDIKRYKTRAITWYGASNCSRQVIIPIIIVRNNEKELDRSNTTTYVVSARLCMPISFPERSLRRLGWVVRMLDNCCNDINKVFRKFEFLVENLILVFLTEINWKQLKVLGEIYTKARIDRDTTTWKIQGERRRFERRHFDLY
jgi:hypothetical protein